MDAETAWWKDGLRFTCVNCGRCCGTYPGTVTFTDDERDAMAILLRISPEEFDRRYVWRKYGVRSLMERSNYDCVLLDGQTKKCSVYEARPAQCRTFPFWRDVIESRTSWEARARECPGMGGGELHDGDDIARTLLLSGDALDI